ncbi:carboxylesterase/lipase family protein [Peristeroidobacter soli]|uniref:carboxylesterase/lipase family protein n=1 Tax=Peristeroidobacter soli TaxID=2497877 RepID=UPI0013008909|nr:carboxylesterase family protein [Peristeroidobacter soli]
MAALLIAQSVCPEALPNDQASSTHRIAKTQTGLVEGMLTDGAVKYLGIPYAKPPVGKLRWANPVAADRWTGVRDATSYGNFCPQEKVLGNFAANGGNEDCLYLNVFAPRKGQQLPVMVWFHGATAVGHSNGYDGSALASEQNVIVVTVNFRLGALGGLVHPALDGGGSTTLYRLRDQQFALTWVKQNIGHFGGDPNNVTLFGESMGGVAIQMHMISPAAKGLFHRAIFQSGPSRYFDRLVPLAEARERGMSFAQTIGCPDQSAACLRNVPVDVILAAQGPFAGACCYAPPINDGHILTLTAYDAIRSGQFNRVPILDVTNRDEHRWFVAHTELDTGRRLEPDEYPLRLQASFGAHAAAVERTYPLSDFDSPSGALAAAQGDQGYACQVRNFDIDASRYVRVYAAEFNDPTSPEISLPNVSFPYLAAHTHEIPYIFPGWSGGAADAAPPLNRQQEKLAMNMRRIWAGFARKGSLDDLPPLTENNESVISLQLDGIRVIDDFSKAHHCELWNAIRNWAPVR